MSEHAHTVVIVGGGFGGLAAAKALRNAPAKVILIDRSNHHLFQPLLYQVATAVLGPAQIAAPIRNILRHNEFERYAPGLKSLADAVAVRNKILKAFEQAEAEEDPTKHQDLLTFVLVGAGPTGVEMAAAIGNLVQTSLKWDFRRINPTAARIVLVDRSKRVLGSFAESLSEAAHRRLKSLGVEILLERGVDQIDEEGVIVAGERIASKTVIWTAGVSPSPAGKWLEVETDHTGRVRIQGDLTVPGHPEVFVLGDTSSLDQDGKPLPGVAQVAMQQGRYAGKLIHRRLLGSPAPRPFRYFDKGSMAVVGKGFAILQTGKIAISGFLAWMAWAAIHLEFLAESSLRVSVFVQWVWTYLTDQLGSRIIVNHHPISKPLAEEASTMKAEEKPVLASNQ
jgi:NADH:ubiquinone reductase (H+-translocating)